MLSTNQPAAYTVTEMSFSPLGMITYIDSGGVTPDSSCVTVSPGNLSPGTYCEPLAVTVAGIAEPYVLNVCLTVLPDSSGGGGDSVVVMPSSLNFTVTEGSGEVFQCFNVLSTADPAPYSIGQINMPPATFFTYIDTGGVSPDTACVGVMPGNFGPGTYCEQLAVSVAGIADPYILNVCLTVLPDSSVGGDTSSTISAVVALVGNYPNPFNPETNISFTLPRTMAIELSVFNVLGQHIKTLVDRPMAAGEHVAVGDGRSESGQAVASGIYFYRLTTEETVATRKMLLLK